MRLRPRGHALLHELRLRARNFLLPLKVRAKTPAYLRERDLLGAKATAPSHWQGLALRAPDVLLLWNSPLWPLSLCMAAPRHFCHNVFTFAKQKCLRTRLHGTDANIRAQIFYTMATTMLRDSTNINGQRIWRGSSCQPGATMPGHKMRTRN